MWILDTWSNESGFPRPFLSGVYEGFWWAIVSMTTVGYGDKIPTSFFARMFAVLWCLCGMLICSISVAYVATIIMDVTHPPLPELNGQRVGALQGQTHALLTIAQHGGIAYEFASSDTADEVKTLLARLEEKKIDGALIGRTNYYCYLRDTKAALRASNAQFTITEKSFNGKDLVAGMLVKNATDYSYFKRYLEMNWAFVQGCFALRNSVRRQDHKVSLQSPFVGLFRPFLSGTLLCLSCIGCFGLTYEIARRKKVHQRPLPQ